jgi:hypothetical protein
MTSPEERIAQALKVTETGAKMQFDKDSQFASALRELLAERERLMGTLEAVDRMFSNPGSINKNTVRDKVRATIKESDHAQD